VLRGWATKSVDPAYVFSPKTPYRAPTSTLTKSFHYATHNFHPSGHFGPMETGATEPMNDRCSNDYKRAYQQNVESYLQQRGLAGLTPAEQQHVCTCYRAARPSNVAAIEIKVRREITAIVPTFYDH